MNAIDYFQAYDNYFWTWEDDFEVISMVQGSTITYRLQIINLLNQMALNGLPPFGSVLLALIATNETMEDNIAHVRSHLDKITNNKTGFQLDLFSYNQVFDFLNTLNALPSRYRSGPNRLLVLQTLFANCHNKLNIKTSHGIVKHLQEEHIFKQRYKQLDEIKLNILSKELRVLSLLNTRFPDVDSIIKAIVDLPEIDENILQELNEKSDSEKIYTDFAEELIDNAYTFEVGSLIKPIWAGFKIPIFNSNSSEQPIGGVSDLSNKGSFDKLLITEFANDELIFMSRLANNEVLYLHREMPPVTDQFRRVLLIDVSLKMWGTPKILAIATWIAIQNHPNSKINCDAFIVGNNYKPVKCTTVHDVIDSLQNVDVSLHPSKGIHQFLIDHKQDKNLELFLLTTEENRKLPEIQTILREHKTKFKYLTTNNIEGEVQLYQHQQSGLKLLQRIVLPLDTLWQKKKPISRNKIKTVLHTNVNLMLLIPTPNELKATFTIEDDIYCISKKSLIRRSVIQNQKTNKGWEIVFKNIPSNGLYEMGKTTDGYILLLAFTPENRELSIYNITTQEILSTNFFLWKSDQLKDFVFHNNRFLKIIRRVGYEIMIEENQIQIRNADPGFPIYDIYANREKESNRYANPPSYINILKRPKSIYTSDENTLVINSHQLLININHKCILTNHTTSILQKNSATYNKNSCCFEFNDGSTVEINPNGYIQLQSSDESIPTIYLSSIVDYPLGMATAHHFAGDEFYYNEKLTFVDLYIKNVGPHKLSIIKALREFSDIGLKEAKEFIDNAPTSISYPIHYQNAAPLVEKLESLGCEAQIVSNHAIKQEIIPSNQFYELYIHKFISVINQS